jgi:hypothetical protein
VDAPFRPALRGRGPTLSSSGSWRMSGAGMQEQMSLLRTSYEVPRTVSNGPLWAVIAAVAVIVIPWALVGWMIWSLS